MKRLATIFFSTTTFCLLLISVFAQIDNRTLFLFADLPDSDNYKVVLKYKEPIERLNVGWGYYGDTTISSSPSGLHLCSINFYYKTGQPLLLGTVISQKIDCSNWDFHGQVVYYYKSGNIARKENWKAGKLDGVVIYYSEAGNETKRKEYVDGKLIDTSKFSVSADNPMVGTWKYVECLNNDCSVKDYGYYKSQPAILRTSIFIYSQNGVVESRHKLNYQSEPTVVKGNWKYIAKTATSGVLEEYQGEELIERATVKWLSRDRLEYTITFSTNSDAVGRQTVWTRQ